jgi:putative hydrolase of the HAD superfamily
LGEPTAISCLFLDIGGVLLTDGWGRPARERAAARFQLEPSEFEDRHRLAFGLYEEGRLTLAESLDRVVFHRTRPFTPLQFRRFMLVQSEPYPEMIDLGARLKIRHGLKIAAVSNEAREMNAHRIRRFKLAGLVDLFIPSGYVRLRKPDEEIFRLALEITQVPARRVAYLENTPVFVQVAESLGIPSVLHTDYGSTCEKLTSFGLQDDEALGRAPGLDGRGRLQP